MELGDRLNCSMSCLSMAKYSKLRWCMKFALNLTTSHQCIDAVFVLITLIYNFHFISLFSCWLSISCCSFQRMDSFFTLVQFSLKPLGICCESSLDVLSCSLENGHAWCSLVSLSLLQSQNPRHRGLERSECVFYVTC